MGHRVTGVPFFMLLGIGKDSGCEGAKPVRLWPGVITRLCFCVWRFSAAKEFLSGGGSCRKKYVRLRRRCRDHGGNVKSARRPSLLHHWRERREVYARSGLVSVVKEFLCPGFKLGGVSGMLKTQVNTGGGTQGIGRFFAVIDGQIRL